MKISTKRVTGAIILMVVTLTVYGMKYLSCSLREGGGMPPNGVPCGGLITVKLAGDTEAKGIYAVTNGATAADLLTGAGLQHGEYSGSGMATELHNGDEVSINRSGGRDSEFKITAMSAATRFVLDMAMDLNTATEEELRLVPGIGKKIAEDIVVIRRQKGGFTSINELKKITAIRGKQYEELKGYFFIEGPV
ncbi:MAG: helix-hairpin-helix domain-containing protein [Deltaproteobacteria bacterium]|nr:helix-hairpin-helix domain-containing protein [Deltaproteobacteria bacterium]MBN2688759.1 helix-hairpin-helix domain-containing protein [Deltaproteobacteria bacterium]